MNEAISEQHDSASGWEQLLASPPIIQKAPIPEADKENDNPVDKIVRQTDATSAKSDWSSWMRPPAERAPDRVAPIHKQDDNNTPATDQHHTAENNQSSWAGMRPPIPLSQSPEPVVHAPEKVPTIPHEIDRRDNASIEDIKELLEYPRFEEFAFEGLSEKTREKLDTEFASIDEDERQDYANPYKLERRHTRDEYDRFRQEASSNAIRQELSNLDTTTLSKLKEQLEEIDYDEKRGWRGHTKEDFDHFRQETIVNALRTRSEQPEQIKQPEQPEQSKQPEQPSERPEQSKQPRQPGKPEQPTEPEQPVESNDNPPETNPIEQPKSTEPKQPLEQPDDTGEDAKEASAEEDEAARATERAAIEAELKQLKQDLQRNSEDMLKYEPLSAVMVKYEPLSAEDVARSLANRDIDRNLKRANFIKRLWIGKMFRQHYIKSLSKEYKGAKGIAEDYNKAIGYDSREIKPITKDAATLDKPFSLSELIADRNIDPDDEHSPEAKNETTQAITRAIGEFVTAMQNDAHNDDAINVAAENNIRSKFVENIKSIPGMDVPNSNNYIRIAYQVLKLVKNDVALDSALGKINFYNFRILNTQFGKKGYDLERIYDRIDKMKTLDARRHSTAEFYYEKRDSILEEESPYIRQETFDAAA